MILKLWISAFIPREVPGYTVLVNANRKYFGKHTGKTAVPLPVLARLHPFNLTKNTSAGYLTDQRTFSDMSPIGRLPSVRMRSLAELMIGKAGQAVLVNQIHESSGTTEVDTKTGDELGFLFANMSRCSWQFTEEKGVIRLKVIGQASDPLVAAAADIDYVGTFTVRPDHPLRNLVTVEFSGKIDAFPAFECYAQLNHVTKTLFTAAPPPGNTVVNLIGPANRPVSGKVVFP